jgi:DNA excision repair protein ERCC-4
VESDVVYILVDHRESRSSVPAFLREMGMEIKFRALEVGDYVISPEIAVERKSLHDFVTSLFDGRLFAQIDRLSSSYSTPFMIVEGKYEDTEKYVQNPKAVYGALVSMLLNYRINLINVPSAKETAIVLTSLTRQFPHKPPPIVKHVKRESFLDKQVYVVSSLPNVGNTIALRLLEKFGTPKHIFLSSTEELAEIKGLGLKRARGIRLLLDTPWKKDNIFFEVGIE